MALVPTLEAPAQMRSVSPLGFGSRLGGSMLSLHGHVFLESSLTGIKARSNGNHTVTDLEVVDTTANLSNGTSDIVTTAVWVFEEREKLIAHDLDHPIHGVDSNGRSLDDELTGAYGRVLSGTDLHR
ncbi:hypothetical protein DH86_00004269, partial [Scytalidium sp. 3C]